MIMNQHHSSYRWFLIKSKQIKYVYEEVVVFKILAVFAVMLSNTKLDWCHRMPVYLTITLLIGLRLERFWCITFHMISLDKHILKSECKKSFFSIFLYNAIKRFVLRENIVIIIFVILVYVELIHYRSEA